MTVGDVLSVFGDALGLVVIIVMVLVLPSLFVGLFVAVIQAATQVNEQTLSFLPRLIMTLVSIMAAGPWILGQFIDHFQQIFAAIPGLLG
ncbi:MAG: flagellar type III secretion system protein FliQ [Pseudomonadales bacterium]|nr:flagellar type III secretion system protein FliQ [Pseudomonadales bacterium]